MNFCFIWYVLQIIPRIMPAMLGDARVKEKFQDQEYLDTVEHMFREKFIENLDVSFFRKCTPKDMFNF